jgi:hypothetical protein
MPSTFETALEEHKSLVRRLTSLEQDIKSSVDRENILKGRIEVLDQQLLDAKAKADHWMTCTIEIARQMHNVGMFVTDAMNLARAAVGAKSNGGMQAAIDAVEQALIGVQNEPVQSSDVEQRVQSDKANR